MLPLLPMIGEGASWVASTVIPYLLFNFFEKNAAKAGAKLVGKTALEVAEGAAGKLAGTATGGAIDAAAAKLPAVLAKRATTGALTRGLITGGAGIGSMIAGAAGTEALMRLLSPEPQPDPAMQQALNVYTNGEMVTPTRRLV